ncbi:conserved hypothetical protein [Crocosphaera subtropica ATCC 51142]|uniref:Uncharacterized protein n=1 Tax=Crocosphaera subtropica (strain ATCC 51142 / BH68) TaxID=43989 RepID=B1WU37_CROS5|nr:hypothetical protein [Crocosphaera subtropica]ACB52099.1 conserved hypothetical protein [Crocosphaera subtropica ATCC 51142]
MINLRQAVFYEYVDDGVVEIFDRYKWGLRRLGVNFSQDLLETIVYCPHNLENTFMAFCSWVLWLKSKGEKTNPEILSETLMQALKSDRGWIPYDYQKDFLAQHLDILESPQLSLWKAAGQQLGERLRNRIISDISEEGKINFHPNSILTDEEKEKIEAFKVYIDQLYL